VNALDPLTPESALFSIADKSLRRIRISLMSTGPSKRGKPSPHTPKN
jgi:hypothetical protein